MTISKVNGTQMYSSFAPITGSDGSATVTALNSVPFAFIVFSSAAIVSISFFRPPVADNTTGCDRSANFS